MITEIQQAEEQLRLAMIGSDIAVLEEVLHEDLIFTNHLGQVMSKQDDIALHQSGVLQIEDIALSRMKINEVDDFAVVSVQAEIQASFHGESSQNRFRFTRVWRNEDSWKVIAGHSCLVVSD